MKEPAAHPKHAAPSHRHATLLDGARWFTNRWFVFPGAPAGRAKAQRLLHLLSAVSWRPRRRENLAGESQRHGGVLGQGPRSWRRRENLAGLPDRARAGATWRNLAHRKTRFHGGKLDFCAKCAKCARLLGWRYKGQCPIEGSYGYP